MQNTSVGFRVYQKPKEQPKEEVANVSIDSNMMSFIGQRQSSFWKSMAQKDKDVIEITMVLLHEHVREKSFSIHKLRSVEDVFDQAT